MKKYFENIRLIENTLLPYFSDEYPLISLNKQFSKLNYEKYNIHLQPHGILEIYSHKSKLILEKVTYRNGKLDGLYQEWWDFSEECKLYQKCWYKNNKIDGLYESWYYGGQLWEKGFYKNGKKEGLYRVWNSNRRKDIEKNYKNGILNGSYKLWGQDGNLLVKYNYIYGYDSYNLIIILTSIILFLFIAYMKLIL